MDRSQDEYGAMLCYRDARPLAPLLSPIKHLMLHRCAIILLALLITSTLIMSGCERAKDTPPVAPVAWSSTHAPYTLVLPVGWQPFPPDIFENGADFAANLNDHIVMVLATPVPKPPGSSEDGAASPHISRYAKESIAQLRKDVQDFEVLDQRAATLGTHHAEIITANGSVQGRQSRYMIAYTGVPGWRFQIVAWAHHSHAAELSDDFDQILTSWTMDAPSSSATHPDAGHLIKSD